MQNIHAFAVQNATNYVISYVFCKLFRFPTFVSELLCDKLANPVLVFNEIRSMCVFRRKYVYSVALGPVRPPIIVGNPNEVRNKSTLRTDLAPPTSSCRGGMGEAQGDPPRHFRRSTRRGERMPNGSAKQLQYSYSDTPIRRNARDPSYRTSSTRSSRNSKILDGNSIFRHNMRYFPWSTNYMPL